MEEHKSERIIAYREASECESWRTSRRESGQNKRVYNLQGDIRQLEIGRRQIYERAMKKGNLGIEYNSKKRFYQEDVGRILIVKHKKDVKRVLLIRVSGKTIDVILENGIETTFPQNPVGEPANPHMPYIDEQF